MLKDFVKRHRDWTPEKDREELQSEIANCLKESKKKLSINIKRNTIYAEVDPEHLIEDLLAKFLSLQFPKYFIVLESPRGTFVAGKGVAGVVKTQTKMKRLVEKLGMNNIFENKNV